MNTKLQEQIESARDAFNESCDEVKRVKQALEIAEKVCAGRAQTVEDLLTLQALEQRQEALRTVFDATEFKRCWPKMTAAEHNAYPHGRFTGLGLTGIQ